jgi:hypothetical protein
MVYRSRAAGFPAFASGALLAVRQMDFTVGRIAVGDDLHIHVIEDFGAGPLAQLRGYVTRREEPIANGVITVMSGALPTEDHPGR